VTAPGWHSVNAGDGTDTLIVDYSSLSTNVRYWHDGWGHYSDGFFSQIDFVNFERYDIRGGSGADYLVGGSGDDSLTGNDGNDVLDGGLGADVISGGAGMDLWRANLTSMNTAISVTLGDGIRSVGGTGGTVSGIEAVELQLGAGNDYINTRNYSGDNYIASADGDDTIAVGGGNSTLHGGDGTDLLIMNWSHITDVNQGIRYSHDGWGHYSSNSGDSVDFVAFELYKLTGGAGRDDLRGGDLADTLVGGDGNDTLRSYQGTDMVIGGKGTDTWEVDTRNLFGNVHISLGNQSSDVGHTLAGLEQLSYTGGDANDFLTALDGQFNDSAELGGGNDTFASYRGKDWAHGGDGTDTLIMDWSGITDSLNAISYWHDGWGHYRSASGDSLDYVAFEQFNMTGGAGRDDLRGADGNDTLKGGAGDDTLRGARGDDIIDGGAGTDLWVGDTSDQPFALIFKAKGSQYQAQGTALGLEVRNIEAVSLSSGAANDRVETRGYRLNDSFYSNGGNDTFNGGEGNDTFHGGDGTDLLVIDWSGASNAIRSWYDGWTHYTDDSGLRSVDFVAVERFKIKGGSGDDTLTGGALKDTLTGGAGDDVLNGGAGGDKINGGDGNDTMIKDDSGSNVSISLFANVNGSGSINGLGGRFYNIENFNISTGSGNDMINLNKLDGNDTISSGKGDDTINVGKGDYAWVHGGDDTDTLIADLGDFTSGVSLRYDGWHHYESSVSGQELVYTGIEKIDLTGTAFADRLSGHADNDTLHGGGGSDILEGGGGNDLLYGDAGADMFLFTSTSANIGIDRIADAEAGDFLRISALNVAIGAVQAGDGSAVGKGMIDISSAGGVTTLHVGLDTTAGSDLDIELAGVFTLADFSADGSDLFLI
jgi:Ca2+-binding RTX toxin-like protein